MSMMIEPSGNNPWEKKFVELINKLSQKFHDNKINEFLITNQEINKLFTDKLQEEIDRKPKHDTKEFNINIDEKTVKMLDDLNNRLNTLNKIDWSKK